MGRKESGEGDGEDGAEAFEIGADFGKVDGGRVAGRDLLGKIGGERRVCADV